MDERRLRKFFQFTEHDLSANRRGQFSSAQEKRLSEKARTEQKSARDSAVIVFVIGAAGLAIGLTIGFVAPSLTGRILILLLMGILWPSVWVGRGVKILRDARRLQEPCLREVSARAQLIQHAEGDHALQLGEMEFDLDGNPAGILMDGDEYSLYYVEATGEILSVDYPIKEK